jgi:hypothetical protein
LDFLGLVKIERLSGALENAGFATPFADQERELLHGGALGFEIRNSGWLSHASG